MQARLDGGAVVNAAGTVDVGATASTTARAWLSGGSGTVGVAVTVIEGVAKIADAVLAQVGDGASVTAGGLTVHVGGIADAPVTRTAVADVAGYTVGLVAVGVLRATADVTGSALARIGDATITVLSGAVIVAASVVQYADAQVSSGSGGIAAVDDLEATARIGTDSTATKTSAIVDKGATLTVGSLSVARRARRRRSPTSTAAPAASWRSAAARRRRSSTPTPRRASVPR